MYSERGLSTSAIARVYNCNPETVRRIMIKHKIARRRLHERKYKIKKEELEILYLKEKKSTIEIAKKYNCSQWVIWSLLKKYRINARGANEYHSWKSPSNQIKPVLDESPTLAYAVGVILGDGWTYKRGHFYTIGLEVSDKKFCESFHVALKKLNLNPSMFHSRGYWRTVCSSKLFYLWLESLDINHINKISKKYPEDFLRGFYESEGHLSVYKSKEYYFTRTSIIICNTKKEWMYLIRSLLESLDFHPKIYNIASQKPKWKPLWRLVLARNLEAKRFISLVKPCIKIGEKRRRNL